MNPAEPHPMHVFLQRLVGDWTIETTADSGDGNPPQILRGRETVRAIGNLWVVGESFAETPGDGGICHAIITLGYDPKRARFTGSWIGSVMTHFWAYDGEWIEAEQCIILQSLGPRMDGQEGTANYRDVLRFQGPDQRTLTGMCQAPDGNWMELYTATYRRS